MAQYNYQERMKREDEIYNFIDSIRDSVSENSENLYIDKESLSTDDINNCIDAVWTNITESTKPEWIVCDSKLKESIAEYVYNFIKYEHDNLVSIGSASINYFNNMLDSRSNLSKLLRNQ